MKTIHNVICPYCNDTAFRYLNGTKEMFLCHSCQRNTSWSFITKHQSVSKAPSVKMQINYSSLLPLAQKLSDLPSDHLARQYVKYRKLPESVNEQFYYTDKMSIFAQATEHELIDGQPKLIIPFLNEEGKMFGLQARSLDNALPKYITLMFDKDAKKIYGLDRVNTEKQIICVEGPIDSLFLNNCIAMAGSDGLDNKYKTNTVVAFDNEPRSKQTVAKMKKYLSNDYKIVVWPDKIKQKDVNDMIMQGINVEDIILNNTYSGIQGEMKLNSWKRV